MVRQGNIIKLNFDPQSGREQAGYRPAVVIPEDLLDKIIATVFSEMDKPRQK